MKLSIEDVLAIVKVAGTDYVERIACKQCGQMLYNHAVGDSGHPDVVYKSIAAHLELAHGFVVERHLCDDPNCWKSLRL